MLNIKKLKIGDKIIFDYHFKTYKGYIQRIDRNCVYLTWKICDGKIYNGNGIIHYKETFWNNLSLEKSIDENIICRNK